MNWPFPGAGPTLGLFLVCLALAGIWWRERRQADALHRKLQLAAEAESDRLRLRISALQSGQGISGPPAGGVDTPYATDRVTELEGELADLQARHSQARQTVAELEDQLTKLQQRANGLGELEQQVANLSARESELERALAQSGQRLEGNTARAKVAKKANPKKASSKPKVTSKAADGGRTNNKAANGQPNKKAGKKASKKAKKTDGAAGARSSKAKANANAGHRDDLQVFNGIGPAMEKALNEAGVRTWEQVAGLGATDADELVGRLPGGRSRVDRERWIEQAETLIEQYPLGNSYDRPDRKSLARQGS